MQIYNEKDFIRGWFVGNFMPSCLATDQVEVAVKRYKENDYEKRHFHKIATEITYIITGSVKMNDVEYTQGDIIQILPNESTDFLATSDTITVVVKMPCVKNDKYIEEE
jgi:quercetin dioxygenase-like cupin family protein